MIIKVVAGVFIFVGVVFYLAAIRCDWVIDRDELDKNYHVFTGIGYGIAIACFSVAGLVAYYG